ncbi:MAG: transglycosylase SLT domain-containing protein [Rhodobacteraceae bacterium]|nr:transglycosylase SLT domain-containing protein [Paracoccaceae bacterium]
MRRFVTAAIFAAIGAVGPGAAQDAPPAFKDFTFKRLKPPKSGSRPKITVQVDPTVDVFATAPADAGAGTTQAADEDTVKAAAPKVSGYEWFWAEVPSALGISGAERLSRAMTALSKGADGTPISGPRLQSLRKIVDRHGSDILLATLGKDVSPALVLAVISVESAGQVAALSGAGAQGLMQLMPDTATRFDVTDTSDPRQNITGGAAYLDWLTNKFDGDVMLALAGYNAGENAVTSHSGVPPYVETRAYVPKVLAAWEVARGLCKTRPELITDACVFIQGKAASDG